MATHVIRVGVKEESLQTTTVFPVNKNDHVNFVNRGPSDLTVTFDDPAGSPLCMNQGGAPSGNPIVVSTGATGEFKVCRGDSGQSFAYTAQITGYAAEDPIVIIEGYRQLEVTAFMAASAGLIAGVALCTTYRALMTRFKARKPSMQA